MQFIIREDPLGGWLEFLLQAANLFFQFLDGPQLAGTDRMGGKGLLPFLEFRSQDFDLPGQVFLPTFLKVRFDMAPPLRF